LTRIHPINRYFEPKQRSEEQSKGVISSHFSPLCES
jgi:hypothetical protein